MKSNLSTTLNVTYFHTYLMSYDLIAMYIQKEMNIEQLYLRHFPDPKSLLKAAEDKSLDIVLINSSSLFDGFFREAEVREMISELCKNKYIITVLFVQNMKAALLKKMINVGIDIIISPQDRPQELVSALKKAMRSPSEETYISQSLQEIFQEGYADLTPKEWEVINLIQRGYSLSEISSKKCRAKSTISTQKRNAMNKLHLRNETELLHFLQQNNFFNSY